jgi:hypothetical protein
MGREQRDAKAEADRLRLEMTATGSEREGGHQKPERRDPGRWLQLGRGAEVNPLTGGLRIDPDLELPSLGMPVDIRFYYYSQDAHSGPFGYGRNMS